MKSYKYYETYADMVADNNPPEHAIIKSTGAQFNYVDGKWIFGFIDTVSEVKESDYTAFEVFAHETDIPVGESVELGGIVSVELPASTVHKFSLQVPFNENEIKNIDVVIDWGDGYTTKMSDDGAYSVDSSDEKDCSITVMHDYNTTGKFIVRIYGKDYYCFGSCEDIPGNVETSPDIHVQKMNLVCRCLDTDLPIASHITNIASAFKYASHLINVRIPEYYNLSRFINFSYLFRACHNLRSVTGLKNRLVSIQSMTSCFSVCKNLSKVDMTAPSVVQRGVSVGVNRCFIDSYCDIKTFMSENAFSGCKSLNVEKLFYNCRFPQNTVIDPNWFWNNKNIEFLKTEDCFTLCEDYIRAQVPVSWGGTAPDTIIAPEASTEIANVKSTVAELDNKILGIEQQLSGVETELEEI